MSVLTITSEMIIHLLKRLYPGTASKLLLPECSDSGEKSLRHVLKTIQSMAELVSLDLRGGLIFGVESFQRRLNHYVCRDGGVISHALLIIPVLYGEEEGREPYEKALLAYPPYTLRLASALWVKDYLKYLGRERPRERKRLLEDLSEKDLMWTMYEAVENYTYEYLPTVLDELYPELIYNNPEITLEDAKSLSSRELLKKIERSLKTLKVDKLYINTYRQTYKACTKDCIDTLQCIVMGSAVQAAAFFSKFMYITFLGSGQDFYKTAELVGSYYTFLHVCLLALIPLDGLNRFYHDLSPEGATGRIRSIQYSIKETLPDDPFPLLEELRLI